MFAVVLGTIYALADVDQSAVDELSSCWRGLRQNHGSAVHVAYVCDPWLSADCRLTVATCELTIPASDVASHLRLKGSDAEFDFTLELQHDASAHQFRVMVKDHHHQGVVANGTVGDALEVPKRQLGVQDVVDTLGLSFHVDANWKGWTEGYLYGIMSDCSRQKCPSRWKDCWEPPAGLSHTLLQLQVFVVMHATFCAHFDSVAQCADYVGGVFRDVNLVYEAQIGISLRPSFLLPPDAIARYWPVLTTYDDGHLLHNLASIPCDHAAFKRVIGRPSSDFGLFHIFVGDKVTLPNQKVLMGRARQGILCNCAAVSWTAYLGDKGTNVLTWETAAHEIAHHFGGEHYFSLTKQGAGADKNAGILGYGSGKVDGVFAFNDLHKARICSTVRHYASGGYGSGCLHPYFGPSEVDPRFGPRYEVILTMLIISALIISCCLVFCIFMSRRNKALRLALANAEKSCLQQEKSAVAKVLTKSRFDAEASFKLEKSIAVSNGDVGTISSSTCPPHTSSNLDATPTYYTAESPSNSCVFDAQDNALLVGCASRETPEVANRAKRSSSRSSSSRPRGSRSSKSNNPYSTAEQSSPSGRRANLKNLPQNGPSWSEKAKKAVNMHTKE